MKLPEKNQTWVINDDIQREDLPNTPGIQRQMLAFCDAAMCVQNYFEAGAVGPLHSHPHTQITYIVDGAFEFTVGDETRIVTMGDTILKQDDIIHGCVCLEAGSMIDFFTPMREDFVN